MQIRNYDTILESLNVGYFYIDKDGIIQDANEAWVKLYKYNSRDEIIGRHFVEIQKIDDREKAIAFVKGVFCKM